VTKPMMGLMMLRLKSGAFLRRSVAATVGAALLCLSGLSASPALAAEPWPPESARIVDRLVAIVNSEPVTLFELQRAAAPMVQQVLRTARDPAERDKALKAAIEEALDSLVDDILVYAQSLQMSLTIAPDRVDAHIAKIRDANGWTDEDLAAELTKLGFASVSDYRRHTEREMLKSQVIGIKVASRVKLDEADVEAEFKRQTGQTGTIQERRAAHILIRLSESASTEAEAKARALLLEARAQITSGATTFGDAARRMSEDGTRSAGGDLGWFVRGDYHPDFERVAFDTDIGAVSEPFRTPFGLHIVTTVETREKRVANAEDTETVKRQIRFTLREKQLEKVYRQWVKSLRTDVFVEIKDLGLDS